MQKAYEIKLRLYESNVLSTSIQYVTGDRETMPLHIRLLGKDGAFAIPTGSVAEINFRQQNGARFLRIAEIEDYGEGKIIYNVAAGDISLPGEVTASVTIVTGDKRLTWQEFRFRIVRGLNEGQTTPPSAVEPWQNAITAKLSDHEGRIVTLEQSGGGSSGTGGTGKDGKSAYEIWLEQGNVGTEQDFLDSLRGRDGDGMQISDTPPNNTNVMWVRVKPLT